MENSKKNGLQEANVFEKNLVWIFVLIIVIFWVAIRKFIPDLFIGNLWFLLTVIIFFLWSSIINIPAKPSHIGILTILGKKRDTIIPEGNNLLKIPYLSNIIKVKLEKITKTFTYKDIKCVLSEVQDENGKNLKSGGTVEAVVDVVIIPDKHANRLAKFIDSGGEKGVFEIIDGIIGETLRQTGAHTTWEQMQFANNWLSMLLITRLTGKKPRVPKNRKLNALPENMLNTTESYNNEDYFENAKEIDYKELASSENPLIKECITRFITGELINGIPDSKELGVLISRLNVKNVTPSGDLKEESEKAAIEVQQKRAELKNIKSLTEQALLLKKAYETAKETVPLKECIKEAFNLRVLENKEASLFTINGNASETEKIAASIASTYNNSKKGGK